MIVRQFEFLSKNDGTGWAGFLAVAAEDASDHVDLVPSRVSLAGTESLLVRILGCLNVNTFGRACASAERTPNAPLQSAVVPGQNMTPSRAGILLPPLLWVLNRDLLVPQPLGGDPKPAQNWTGRFLQDSKTHELTSSSVRGTSSKIRCLPVWRLIFSCSFIIP